MNKLKAAVFYECSSVLKAICIFYGVEYLVLSFVTVLLWMGRGDVGVSGFEMNTVIFVGIFGVLSFSEDFKMLLQNGFTRKYIYASTICCFAFTSGLMGLVDTIMGNFLHYIWPEDYSAVYGSIYGYGRIFANWLWLAFLYMSICCLFYLGVLIINKIGKSAAVYLAIVLAGVLALIVMLFRYILSAETVVRIRQTALGAMGVMTDGTVNRFLPLLTFLALAAVLGTGAYSVIRRTELKG